MKRVCIIFRAIWTRYSNFSYRFHRNPFGRQPVGVVESRWPLLRSGNRSRTSGRRIFLFPHSLSLFEEYFPYRLKFVSAFSGPCIEERQNDSTLLWWRLRHNELDSAGRVNGKKMDKKNEWWRKFQSSFWTFRRPEPASTFTSISKQCTEGECSGRNEWLENIERLFSFKEIFYFVSSLFIMSVFKNFIFRTISTGFDREVVEEIRELEEGKRRIEEGDSGQGPRHTAAHRCCQGSAIVSLNDSFFFFSF